MHFFSSFAAEKNARLVRIRGVRVRLGEGVRVRVG